MLVSIDQLDESTNRYLALDTQPGRGQMAQFSEEALIADVPPEIVKGNMLGTDENLTKRKEMLEAVSQEPMEFAFERAIGKNDSVYSNFIELISIAKQKVGRIFIKNGSKKIGFATGFMVAENLMLTNWHVFKTSGDVADSELQFFYEYDIFGNAGTPTSFQFDTSVFFYSNKVLDYCFVAVKPVDISGAKKLKDIGYIFLDRGLGKLGSEGEEALNIIHHPNGDLKQLSIRENLFIKITPTSIWYKTDTAPGSSGGPVFNDQWQVVALHHMGVGKRDADGNYLDKDGNIISKVNGVIDASKVVWEANEGIRISVILKDLFITYPDNPVIKGLLIEPVGKSTSEGMKIQNDKQPPIYYQTNNSSMESNNSMNNVSISFPASLVEKNGVVIFSINQGTPGAQVQPQKSESISSTEEALDRAEIKKLEETTDFASCKGYQSKFLGSAFNIPLPQPMKSIRKFIAKIGGTDSIVLKYHHYSVIFHSVRMMPILSAINVDGDLKKRKDTTERKDVWLRDSRLSFDIQLSDSYYYKSGFDRGHMSRREDANWGATAEEAKRNADLTCMYTNACPQVSAINQSKRKGLWGKLELVVLESGATAETGKTAKVTVFNGPIFKEEDPVFRGIQIPMDFYKIVLWLTDGGNLKATAFKLSQVELVDDIDFEQLDLDQNTEFKEFQCSIKSLQKDTKIDFSEITKYDTFDNNEAEEIAINSELEVMTHIIKHSKL